MDPLALALVLVSAALHASWNLVVKTSSDRLVAAWLQVSFGAILFLPALLIVGVPTAVWPSIVASGLIHLGYGLSLITAYQHGDLSLVYPVARGVAPILVTVAAAIFLDDFPGPAGLVAILVVVAGVLWTALGAGRHGLGWALATGVLIASYTVVDGAAVRTLEGSFAYTSSLFVMNALVYVPVLALRRSWKQVGTTLQGDWWRQALAGAASALAYVLVLAAARLAPLGLVAALRETSVLFGVVLGWTVLGETGARRRLQGAALIAAGLAVLILAR